MCVCVCVCVCEALHDLAVHAIARHAGLGCPAVAAHLQSDQTLTLAELLLSELPPVTLGLPGHTRVGVRGIRLHEDNKALINSV